MPRSRTTFHMLDVGQGSCCVWASPTTDIIIDAHIPAEGPHVKSYLLGPASVTSPISLFMVTGWDRDHAHPMGVGMVTRNFQIDEVWIPQWPNDTTSAAQVRDLLASARWSNGQRVIHPNTQRERYFQLGDTKITLFSPHPADVNSSNNASIVAKLESGGFSVLVTGDCEVDRWESIVRYFKHELAADVLVAPHHGSANGVHGAALRYIQPSVVLVSAGDTVRPNHPHPEAIRAYRSAVSKNEAVRVTKDHGHIRAWREGTTVRWEWEK